MKRRYKILLELTRDIRSYDEFNGRCGLLFLIWDCGFISIDLYLFLKRKIIQSAYLNGVDYISYMINLYFSKNTVDSFNHYVITNKRCF